MQVAGGLVSRFVDLVTGAFGCRMVVRETGVAGGAVFSVGNFGIGVCARCVVSAWLDLLDRAGARIAPACIPRGASAAMHNGDRLRERR